MLVIIMGDFLHLQIMELTGITIALVYPILVLVHMLLRTQTFLLVYGEKEFGSAIYMILLTMLMKV